MEAHMSKKPNTKALTNDHTITIAGVQFTLPIGYAEGHVLTAGEAGALNQAYFESIRNNLASKVKNGQVGQAEVDEYAAGFQFGGRTGSIANPVESMALAIARKKVDKRGRSASEITAAAHELLASEKGVAIKKAAAQMVEA